MSDEKQKQLTTKEKANEIVDMLIAQAHTKLKSGEDLSASEMKVCLDVCKAYSKEPITKKEHNILDEVPFDDGQKN